MCIREKKLPWKGCSNALGVGCVQNEEATLSPATRALLRAAFGSFHTAHATRTRDIAGA